MAEVEKKSFSPSRRLLVTTATYNEIENIAQLVDEIFRYVPEATLLVVDDNSPDGTGRWVAALAAEDPRVRLLARPGKLGLGSAIREAMKLAVAEGFTWLVNLDADLSHDPAVIPQLVATAGDGPPDGADVVIGSRYVAGGRIEGWPLRRHLMSRWINAYTRLMLGLDIRDCSSGYRCFRTEMLARLPLDQLRSSGYAFQEEVLWHLVRAGARVVEMPIVFRDREHGRSKITLREAVQAVRLITRLGCRR